MSDQETTTETAEETTAETTEAVETTEQSTETTTIAEDPGKVESDVPPAWREDWRQAFAGKNDEALKTLNRFKTPEGVWKAYESLRQKVSSGEYTRTKPQTEDADALKAWRAEIGLPETPEGYLDKLPDGLEIPGEDQPLVDKYLERMHAEGASPKHVHDGLAWYYETQQALVEERAEADKEFRARSEDELRSEWGPEYRGNLNGMRSMLESYGSAGLQEEILTARTDDGTMLGDHPGFLRMLVNLSSEINPQGIVTPTLGEDRMASIETRIAELEAEMGDTKARSGPDSYWNNQSKQEEYRRLLELQDKHKTRAA